MIKDGKNESKSDGEKLQILEDKETPKERERVPLSRKVAQKINRYQTE